MMEFETLDAQLKHAQYHPNSTAAHTYLGFMYVKRGGARTRATCYETALRLNPKMAEARRGLALVLTQLGEDEALEELRTSGPLADSMVNASFVTGHILGVDGGKMT